MSSHTQRCAPTQFVSFVALHILTRGSLQCNVGRFLDLNMSAILYDTGMLKMLTYSLNILRSYKRCNGTGGYLAP